MCVCVCMWSSTRQCCMLIENEIKIVASVLNATIGISGKRNVRVCVYMYVCMVYVHTFSGMHTYVNKYNIHQRTHTSTNIQKHIEINIHVHTKLHASLHPPALSLLYNNYNRKWHGISVAHSHTAAADEQRGRQLHCHWSVFTSFLALLSLFVISLCNCNATVSCSVRALQCTLFLLAIVHLPRVACRPHPLFLFNCILNFTGKFTACEPFVFYIRYFGFFRLLLQRK